MAMMETSQTQTRMRTEVRSWLPLGFCFLVLFAASFLPPDVSLRGVDEKGVLSVCIPENYPPLVTADTARPGFDIDLLEEVARRAGWRTSFVRNTAMGRDFNPRSWHITRAQCSVVAGGVALSGVTQSFMNTSAGHLRTGWAEISTAPGPQFAEGARAGVLVGMGGLDRIALGQFLRQSGVEARIVASGDALVQGLLNGDYDLAITEMLLARSLADEDGRIHLRWLSEEMGRVQLGFGFWRGETTLMRRITAILDEIEADGTMAELAERYSLGPETLCPEGDC